MEQFRASVVNIFEAGSANEMLLFLERCWRRRSQDALKSRSATGAHVARLAPAEQPPELGQLIGGPGGVPAWDPLVLWICPTRRLLDAIAEQVRAAGLSSVTSLGSGTGLLEWLLQQCSGLEVTSLEVNRSWWESSYAPPSFVRHVYTDEIQPDSETHGKAEIYEIPATDAFMTCYFNNADVFSEHLARYEGPLLLIIGSESGTVATRPAPLDCTHHRHWSLHYTVSLGPAPGHDLLAVYVRRTNS